LKEEFEPDRARSDVRRVIQLMNQYGLYEFEFEDKTGDTSVEISRSENESFPPLLEGHRSEVSGKLRSPAVGELDWKRQEGDRVERGDVIAEIRKKDQVEEVTSAVDGTLFEVVVEKFVEYGQFIGSVVPEGDDSEQDEEDR